MKRNRNIAALDEYILNCNGSLAYGDIGFGDGELNQGLVAPSTRLNRSNSLSSL